MPAAKIMISDAMTALDHALLRKQVLLQRLSEGERRKFLPFLKDMDKELRDRLSRDDVTSYSRTRLEKLLGAVDDGVSEILSGYQRSLFEDLEAIARNEADFITSAILKVTDYEAVLPSVSQVKAALYSDPLSIGGSPLLKPFVQDWSAAERKAVSGIIRRGAFQGQTNGEIIRALRGTAARQYQDGQLDITARHAATLVHTAVQHASSMAMQEVVKANSDIIDKERWRSTLDRKACSTCRSLDGMVFKVGEGPRSPIHPNCRCLRTPMLSDEFAHLNSKGTRASAGSNGAGQVSGDLTYYDWLKQQSPAFVKSVLGANRAKLFLDGGLSAERFSALQLDRKWEPLTLDEMRKLEPLAFERAGI